LTRKWPSPHGATSIASLSAPTIAVNSWTVAPFPTANRSFDFQSALLKLIVNPLSGDSAPALPRMKSLLA
jgi:hypothetical protein